MTQRRNAIPIWRKQEVISWIDNEGNGVPTCDENHFRNLGLDIDGASIRKWYRHKEEIMAAKPHQRRLGGGGRKPLSKNMEDMLIDLVADKRLRKEQVTYDWIADQDLACHASLHAEDEAPSPFAASQHWVSNFMDRYSLSLRRRTNLTILSDETLVDRAVAYMRYLRDLTLKWTKIIKFSWTSLLFILKTLTRRRWTSILAVTASGRKLPPVLIWKETCWVDSALLKRWIDLQFPQVEISKGKFLIWDSMRGHISREVKAKCQSRGIGMCVIPGGLTPYLQAGDIAIYRSFKDILFAEINAWKESGDVQVRNGVELDHSSGLFHEPGDSEADAFKFDEIDDALDGVTILHEE
ncbi:Hypothetical protein PHPALM_36794 [Phytophthora palmivora]|uniref:DDE-1 domain-containing protein n=1 Tax=Phytophthora palmivora TaxID=4796 RepID=A0A2P4WZ28_9STRA|nr:Hypothetical protein PHPALM_36794 [Phytophthora palmivora]